MAAPALTRLSVIKSLGAFGTMGVLAGCTAPTMSSVGRMRSGATSASSVLDLSRPVVRGTAKFPLKLVPSGAANGLAGSTGVTCPQSTATCGGSGDGIATTFRNPAFRADAYASQNTVNLYNSTGTFVLQGVATSLNPDDSVTQQFAAPSGTSLTYVCPPVTSVPLNTWVTLYGSTFYLNSSTHTGTVNGADGVTYTFYDDASGNLIIHSNDGMPDVAIPAGDLALLPRQKYGLHTAGYACNAASFVLGMAFATIAIGAVGAIVAAGGKGAAHIVAAGLTIGGFAYEAANAVCKHVTW